MTDEVHNHLDYGLKPPGDCPACDQVRLGLGAPRFRAPKPPPEPVNWWGALAGALIGIALGVGFILLVAHGTGWRY